MRRVILIVEDDPMIRLDAVEMIEAAGFEAIEARHAEEAIVILEARDDIHLIFTDINMPGSMDGLRLAHFVRHRWPPVKILTTSGKERLTHDDLPDGGRFLPKPYSAAELALVLRDMAQP